MTYNVLLVDPPWTYRNKRTGGSLNSGSAAKYPTLSMRQLRVLPVPEIADRDSVLFLWVTVPLLPDGLALLERWGFTYKTMLTWRKIMSLGMGFYFRGQTEHLLLGICGKVKAFRCQKPNIYQSKALKHSRKPEYFRELIEEATVQMPDRRMLELFATERKDGWTSLGLEIDGRDIRESLPELVRA